MAMLNSQRVLFPVRWLVVASFAATTLIFFDPLGWSWWQSWQADHTGAAAEKMKSFSSAGGVDFLGKFGSILGNVCVFFGGAGANPRKDWGVSWSTKDKKSVSLASEMVEPESPRSESGGVSWGWWKNMGLPIISWGLIFVGQYDSEIL